MSNFAPRLRELLLPGLPLRSGPGDGQPGDAWRQFWGLALAEGASSGRLRRIVLAAPISGFGHLLGFLVMTPYMAGKAPDGLVAAWGATMFALAALMIWRGRSVSVGVSPRLSRRAVRRATLFAFVSAAPWAAFAAYIPIFLPEEFKMLPHVGVAGASAGGALILSGIPVAAFVYVWTIILAVALSSILAGSSTSLLFAACAFAYALMLCGFCVQHAAVLTAGEDNERRLRENMADLTLAHASIDQLSKIDPVTGLLNRRALQDMLTARLQGLADAGGAWPLYLIDLDHFKNINDACGHAAGDRYLREIATRLTQTAPQGAIIARLGGDEFALFAPDAMDEPAVSAFGQQIIAAISRNVTIDGRELKAGCSVGAALAPLHTRDISDLLKFADKALLDAKARGRGRFCLFRADQKEDMAWQTREAAALARGLARDEIEMVYQPQFELASRRLVGLEALARWRRPDCGLLGPERFLHLAEAQGLALDLFDAVMHAVERDVTSWTAQRIDFGRIAINIHSAQLSNPDSLDEALEQIGRICGGRGRVTLEIGEDCLIGRGTEAAPALLGALAARGYRISLDDFGAGFAALRHLKDLPIDEIKIDRTYVADMLNNAPDLAIVKAIRDMAEARGSAVIAEGVETARQCETLLRAGVALGQGHYLAKTVGAQDVAALVATQGDALHSAALTRTG